MPITNRRSGGEKARAFRLQTRRCHFAAYFLPENDSRLREKIKGGMKPGELRAAVKKPAVSSIRAKDLRAVFGVRAAYRIDRYDAKKKDRLMMILQMSAGATGADSGQQGKRHGSGLKSSSVTLR